MSDAVGESGTVWAVDLSSRFVDFMKVRAKRLGLQNVKVAKSSAKSVDLDESVMGTIDFVCLIDVYHHIEYPITFMSSVRSALRPGKRLLVCDFHRDPARMTSHEPQWALDHIRASQDVFRAEIESAGFKLVASPELPDLTENYVMIFEAS